MLYYAVPVFSVPCEQLVQSCMLFFTMLEDVRSGDQDSVIATQGATAAFQLLKEKADYLQRDSQTVWQRWGTVTHSGDKYIFFEQPSEKSRNLLKQSETEDVFHWLRKKNTHIGHLFFV